MLEPLNFQIFLVYLLRTKLECENMKDTLIRAISNEHNFRLFVTSTTHLSDEARRRRATPGSIAFVPSVAGLILAGEVVKDLASYV